MAPGIEVFGRRATVIEQPIADEPQQRTAWLGAGALAIALLTAVLTGLGVGAAAAGDEGAAQWLAVGAIGASILSVLIGLAALVTGRGRLVGSLAVLLGLAANPWLLLRVLEFSSAFVG